MFYCPVNELTELRLIDRQHGEELFKLLDSNRGHLRRWHPWVDTLRSASEVERTIAVWQQLSVNNRGFYAGIWFKGRFCGMINHQNVDWSNRWTALSYWLDAAHQGQGIMTACCQKMVSHGFNTWKLNRITIECATENTRSRAVAERLGFKFEGIVRGIEWLHDRYVDHAMYGLLRSDYANDQAMDATRCPESERSGVACADASGAGSLGAGRRHLQPDQPALADCGQRHPGDDRRRLE
jgi:ribosomal-protein-serine acetyltransferase